MADWEDIGAAEGWEEISPKKKGKSPAEIVLEGLRPGVAESIGALRGLGETAAHLGTGAIGGGLGTLFGALAGLREHGFGEKGRPGVEAEAARQAESLTFSPRTEQGKEIAGRAGELISNVLIPLAPMAPLLEGVGAATKTARQLKKAGKPAAPPPGGFAPDVPLTLEEALAQADQLPENQLAGPRRVAPDAGWEDITPPASKRAKLQGELFPEETVEMPAKFNKKGEPVREAGTVQQPRPQTITVSPQGTAMVAPEQLAGYEQFGRTMETPEAPVAPPLRGQGDLFLTDEVTGPIATPFDAAARGALPETFTENPALARRQMDLGFEIEQPLIDPRTGEAAGGYAPPELRPGTMFVDEAGRATTALPERMNVIESDITTLELAQRNAEAKVRELQAKQAVERGETGNLFADYVNQHRDYELFRDENGKPLSRTAFNETVDNLAKEPSTGYIRPEDMDAAYAKYLSNFEGVQAGLFDQPTTALEMSTALKNDATTRLVERHPLVKAAERHLNQEQQFLDQLKQQGANAAQLADAARDVKRAADRLAKTTENVTNGIKGGKTPTALPKRMKEGKGRPGTAPGEVTVMYEGIGESIRRIGRFSNILGAAIDNQFGTEALTNRKIEITPGENKQKYLPQGVKEGLKDYTKERRPAAEIAQEAIEKNTPDIKRTTLTDKVQAGGLYKGLETNNPIVRKTFAAVSDAYNNAHTNIRVFIQDKNNGLPALFRRLNKNEAGNWWATRMAMEGVEDLTPQRMREMGMNEKQIAMNTRLNEALDFAFQKINEARALIGKGPVDKRIGYLAGQVSGDFRRVIYKTGTDEVVGVLGSDSRGLLNSRLKKLLDKHPEWSAGPEKMQTRGRKESRQKAFEDAVAMIAEENPEYKTLLDAYDQILKDDAYNYMNAKKHTMQKKGVAGTEGFKLDVDAWTNAKEGMASQIRYLEKMMNWAEMSKAVDEVKPLLTDDRLNMPNAKEWASNYLDRALGIQTNKIGAGLDQVIGAVGEAFGVGPSALERGVGATKGAVSKVLLGFANPMFLAINLMQPVVALPAMNSLLRSRGISNASILNLAPSMMSFLKMHPGNPLKSALTPFEKTIQREGAARNLFGSEIFDHTTHLRRAGYVGNKIAEVGIPAVEGFTRGITFTHFSKLLEKAGYKGKELFDIAENLTNQTMTDYRNIEAPSIYKEMGAVGEMAVTLQRYKHNSLSSLAMLAREAGRNKSYRPLVTALASGVAFSGITGMLGFNEADAAYQMITKLAGKPDTLTRLVMDKLPDTANFGIVSSLTGIDMSKRFGMALFPDSPSGALFPGASKLVDIGEAALGAATSPTNTTQWERLAREATPGALKGAVDRAFFEDEEGLSINPRTLEGQVRRTDTDKFAKSVGGVGLHESKTKARIYQESLIDKQFAAKRQKITNRLTDDLYQMRGDPDAIVSYFTEGKGADLRDKFLEAEGNIDNLIGAVVKFQEKTHLTAKQRTALATAAAAESGKEGDSLRAKRYAAMLQKLED